MQITDDAIGRSISHNEIVTIDTIDMRRAGVSLESVREALHIECEDEVANGAVCEYWGKSVDGEEWRVHVEMPPGRTK